MDAAARREIQFDCRELSIAYARTLDFCDYDAFANLFTDDAVLSAGPLIEGREAIRNWLAKRPDELRSRHVLTNIFIDPVDADHARGISYLSLYRHLGEESRAPDPVTFDGPVAIGHYDDRFLRTDAGWRFERRTLQLAFRRAPRDGT